MFNNRSSKKSNSNNDKGEFKMDILYKIRRDIITNRNQEKIGEDRLYVVKYEKGEPRVEKRNYFMKDGELLMGKMKGLTKADFELIDEKWNNIEKALDGEKVSK